MVIMIGDGLGAGVDRRAGLLHALLFRRETERARGKEAKKDLPNDGSWLGRLVHRAANEAGPSWRVMGRLIKFKKERAEACSRLEQAREGQSGSLKARRAPRLDEAKRERRNDKSRSKLYGCRFVTLKAERLWGRTKEMKEKKDDAAKWMLRAKLMASVAERRQMSQRRVKMAR